MKKMKLFRKYDQIEGLSEEFKKPFINLKTLINPQPINTQRQISNRDSQIPTSYPKPQTYNVLLPTPNPNLKPPNHNSQPKPQTSHPHRPTQSSYPQLAT